MTARVAVVASNSFTGGHCVDALLDRPGVEVLGISRGPEKSDLFLPYKRRASAAFRYRSFDLNSQSDGALAALDEFRPEVVINFAAQGEVGSSWKWPERWFETNAVALAKLANGLKDRDYLKRFVQISTPEVYGSVEGSAAEGLPMNPSTPYAASKAAGDLFLSTLFKQYAFPVVTVRTTNVYGRHQQLYRIVPRAVFAVKRKARLPLHGGGVARKAFLHVRDAVDGILRAADAGRAGEVYHFSPDGDLSIAELVRRVCALTGADFDSVVEAAAERPGQDARYSIGSQKARRELGWAPKVPLDEGLRDAIAWIEKDWDRLSREPVDYEHRP